MSPFNERGLRIAIAGATGTLGRELVAMLEERQFPVRQLVPFATERSCGSDVEFGGEVLPVESEAPSLRGLDLLIVATPREAALPLVREALRAEVACIDGSGALAATPEVPLVATELCDPGVAASHPAVAIPRTPAHAWALVLSAVDRAAGLRRVVGTVLRSAAFAGRSGIEALSNETIALLSQQEPPDPERFRGPVAFDCVPRVGDAEEEEPGGATGDEAALLSELSRLLDRELPAAVSLVQVPTFVGDGSALCIETERPIGDEALSGGGGALFEKAAGVEVWNRDEVGPTTRDTAGCNGALVSRVRRDPSSENGLLLWVASDAVRLAAANAVRLAEARLRRH